MPATPATQRPSLVNWHPWNETALSAARTQGRPILLSIGYSLLFALLDGVKPPLHVVIPGTDEESRNELKRSVDDYYQVDCYLIGPPNDALPGISGEYRSADPVTAWLYRGMHCLAPESSWEELQQQLEN
jgi:uncharacterized protein YyaL (SSP411 family)